METKFTPGPWSLGAVADGYRAIDALNQRYPHRAMASVVVQMEEADRKTGEDVLVDWLEGAANAHLIASAPELYEALAELARAADQWSGQIEPPPAALDRAWQVLAQARGETNVDR